MLFTKTIISIPSCHRHIVIISFGHEKLMDIDIPNKKCRGTATEIDIPHPDEFFPSVSFNLITDLLKIIIPAHQRLIIMAPQAFYIDDTEIIIIGDIDDFTQ